ncbi:Methylamine utilization protein MauE [Caballeronia glathei]|uniref:Methylamine utilization protein MauE n=1 Tax=Caballeronia glathei TaxID=60547 RepID=A0A069PSG1_9BURK|nr:MauE/DoxX family redox-associated membrane protein [Caballeronia glathei]KDR43643.1 methylamine utilization protein MauE [Caballeronia glathei]CDY75438.1 Methylamine utilization protein MauE [Caballeronia glathei]
MLDPVILMVSLATIAIVVLLGAAAKLREPAKFSDTLAAYHLLPPFALTPVAYAIPALEALGAVGLLFPATRLAAACVVIALFAVFGTALAINVVRGNTDIDCGCAGFTASTREAPKKIGWWHVARVAVLAAVASAALVTQDPRPIVWFDYFTAAAGTLCAVAAMLTLDMLLANLPKLESLRNS